MPGEVQEPFSFNFKVGSLHSGSISFGRFETESLSWERRSSFSHNRYLEEIEKCSKPGSVIEKKAYFEAHFRKKALQSQTASEDKSGTGYQTSNEFMSDNINYPEESEINVNEGSSFSCSDMSPDSSDHHEACEVIDVVVESDIKDDSTVEVKEILIEETIDADEIRLNNAKLNMEVKEILIEEKVNNDDDVCILSESVPVGREVEKNISGSEHQHTFPQLTAAMENKFINSKSRSQVNVTGSQRHFLTTPYEDFNKDSGLPERRTTRVAETVKYSSQPVQRATRTDVSRMEKAKLAHENKRHKQYGKPSKAAITFKSEERAERRKEAKTEAEDKQLRKSLNFNAVPMPSFNHEAVQTSLNKKKVSIICTKSNTIISKSSSSASGAETRSSSHQNEDQTVSINESINKSDSPEVSSLTDCFNSVQVASKIKVAVKKDQRNDTGKCMQKNQVSKANKVIKGLNVENKLNTEPTRSNHQIGRRKESKGGVVSGSH